MEGFDFAAEIRVRFAETDAQGVAHNSNYLVWFEVARVAFLERYAGGYQRLRDQGIESFVLETHVRFRQPARFDDLLLVHARCHAVRGARFRFDYAVERDGTTRRRRLDRARDGRRGHIPADAAAGVADRGDRGYGSGFPAGVVAVCVAVAVAVSTGFAFGFGLGFAFGPTRTIFGDDT